MKIKFDPTYTIVHAISTYLLLICMSADYVMEIANNKNLTWVQTGNAGDVETLLFIGLTSVHICDSEALH